jgi:predicted ATPase
MIDRLKLKFGSSPNSPPLEFDTTPITVFVGPNNSGKSKLIREVFEQVTQGHVASGKLVADEIILRQFTQDEALAAIEEFTLALNPGEVVQPGHVVVGRQGARTQMHLESMVQAFSQFNEMASNDWRKQSLASQLLRYKVRMLDGQGRLALSNDQPFGDLMAPAQSSFQAIWRDDGLRSSLREIVFDALGEHLTFDPTYAGQIRLRLSQQAPQDADEEQALTARSRDFHSQGILMTTGASDGARAFCGIMAEVMAGKPDLLLIDEPEAFLHPTLSFKLAKNLAKQMVGSSKRLFVSTHSPNFLMGCVSAGVPVTVVRLTYRNRVATARILPSEELTVLMRTPLLRSANVLSALFYENAVITEGDCDRAFYQEVNERMLAANVPDRGIPNCIFLNGTGKTQIATIKAALRNFGIPAAGIYDIDFIKDGGAEQSKRLKAASVPQGSRDGLNATRTAVKTTLDATGQNYKRAGGISLLDGAELETAKLYLRTLADYGIFVIPNGEIESWLREFGIGGHATEWLVPMFERLGSDPEAANYVQAGYGDVWDFLQGIRDWLLNPNRAGIPA